ncbi:CDP-glucose 4,6-dehydratase [Candidatus Epulonipiscioides gigas]|nr:CDP-glucose 4,6-dehydratase [Epulopiscium sp. SCG-C07WGA-EpuloA2]
MTEFYRNKKVLITGHTGFKGTWLCKILLNFNSNIVGVSLDAPTIPNLFEITNVKQNIKHYICDIRNLKQLKEIFEKEQPEIIFHLAAQPIVRESYINPVYTYETNVMGTVNILECIRNSTTVKSFLNITTDKVYKNKEWEWGYRENEELNGFDPYSNSKSCSELVTESYKNAFFNNSDISISTARAGNVIGGGDFASDRIIPDCIRAMQNNVPIIVRNPHSIRPYQHVLEPLYAYLVIAKEQYKNKSYAGSYNIGPNETDCITTGDLVDIFCAEWGQGATWENKETNGPHEANFLKLDCSKVKKVFGIAPLWNINRAIKETIEWTKVYFNHDNINKCMDNQIQRYLVGGYNE